MHEPNSSGWYQDLVERLSSRKLTVARIATFLAWQVTILVEEHDPETIARTERLLDVWVTVHAPAGTRAKIVSLQTFEQDARVIRDAFVASGLR